MRKKPFSLREKKIEILGGATETVTLFTCYKTDLYFCKYKKGTPYVGI